MSKLEAFDKQGIFLNEIVQKTTYVKKLSRKNYTTEISQPANHPTIKQANNETNQQTRRQTNQQTNVFNHDIKLFEFLPVLSVSLLNSPYHV